MKRTPSRVTKKSLMTGMAFLVIVLAVAVSAPVPESSWALNLPPPKPVAITAPAPQTPPDATLTEQAPAPVAVDPATGLPAMSGAPPATDTQLSSGTYETLDPAAFKNLSDASESMAILREKTTKSEEVGTLVFTLWQHSLLQDAKELFRTRRPTEGEMAAAMDGSAVEEVRPRGIRELSLSGILYKGKDDWVVWLNGKRLAPDAIPKEVIDIKVSKDFIDLKWFDEYTNLIYPIRIRPHQRFNLDTRIFLPGITADAAAQLQAASMTP